MLGKTLIVVGEVSGDTVLAEVLKGTGSSVAELVSGIDFIHKDDQTDGCDDAYDVVDKNPKGMPNTLGNLCRRVDRGDSLLVVGCNEWDTNYMLKTVIRRRANVNKGLLIIDRVNESRLKQAKEILSSKGLVLGKDVSVVVTDDEFTGAQGIQNLYRYCKNVGWVGLMDTLDMVVYENSDVEAEQTTELYKVVHGFNGYGLLKM